MTLARVVAGHVHELDLIEGGHHHGCGLGPVRHQGRELRLTAAHSGRGDGILRIVGHPDCEGPRTASVSLRRGRAKAVGNGPVLVGTAGPGRGVVSSVYIPEGPEEVQRDPTKQLTENTRSVYGKVMDLVGRDAGERGFRPKVPRRMTRKLKCKSLPCTGKDYPVRVPGGTEERGTWRYPGSQVPVRGTGTGYRYG